MRVAVVEGDDLSDARGRELLRDRLAPADAARELVSANAYLGAAAIAEALRAGAQVVVTGRVADPSLAVGPAMAHFGWGETDWDELGRATIAGHLIECGAQVTGGYFADPGLQGRARPPRGRIPDRGDRGGRFVRRSARPTGPAAWWTAAP